MSNAISRAKMGIGWMSGKTAADVVWHNHAKVIFEFRDEMAKKEAPGRIAVQADDDRSAALIDIVHLKAKCCCTTPLPNRHEVGLEGIRFFELE